jgi:MarR family 2-MHQ and catechol resistance regulon transcriptional repressor
MARTRSDDELAYVKTGMGDDLDTVLVFNLLRTHAQLGPYVGAHLRGQRLTASQLNALLVLRAAGREGLRMGEIGRKLVVTKSNVTGLIDRLERGGLVVRAEHRDRRATAVRLTAVGEAALRRAIPRHARVLPELTRGLSDTEKRALIRLLTKLRRGIRLGRQEVRP